MLWWFVGALAGSAVGLWLLWEVIRSAVAAGTRDAQEPPRRVLTALGWIAALLAAVALLAAWLIPGAS